MILQTFSHRPRRAKSAPSFYAAFCPCFGDLVEGPRLYLRASVPVGVIVFGHLRPLLKLCYDGKNGKCMTIKMTPSEGRTKSLSYADATWRDVNNAEHTRYMVHAMKPGPGFEIIDTNNNANWSVVSNFATEADARERMRTK